MQKKLRQCQMKFNRIMFILNNLPSIVYWKNKKGVYMGANDFMISRLELPLLQKDKVIGKTDYDLFPKEIADEYRLNDLKVMNSGKELVTEETAFLQDGKKMFQISSKKPLYDDEGKIIGVIGYSVDITDRKEMEQRLHQAKEKAEMASQLKSEFIANMRHDLRTPASGIAEMAKILEQNETNTEKKQSLHHLTRSSKMLLNLLNSILEFDHIESGKLPICAKRFDIKRMIRDAIDLEKSKAEMKDIELLFNFTENVPEQVIGDEQRVQRVLLNLLGNAMKFTHKGYVKVSLGFVKQQDKKNILLKLTVKDTGIGIPEDKQQFIYDKFYRVTPASGSIYKGLGLGLNIVKQFVEELGGDLKFESKENEGTTFTCILPFKLPLENSDFIFEPGEEKIEEAEPVFAKEDISPCKVLLIEDDELSQIVVVTKLRNELHANVDTAITGKEAISLVQNNVYDLIFMDIGLPDIDGYEVAKWIRTQAESKNVATPIIALTAHSEHSAFHVKESAFAAGMNDLCTKPLSFEKGKEILYRWVFSNREANRDKRQEN
jgi:two-component system aerobic respiration control sensor histidine kinase ArcB